MSAALPELLDPIRAVGSRSVYRGSMPLAGLPRLREILVDDGGEAHYDLTFRRDEAGYAVVIGRVRATLVLECQRCLGPMHHPVDAAVSLALVGGYDEARALPDCYEPLLVEEGLMSARGLLEDELLLGIPQIPMHPRRMCEALGAVTGDAVAEQPDAAAETTNPFSVLADWKRNNNT